MKMRRPSWLASAAASAAALVAFSGLAGPASAQTTPTSVPKSSVGVNPVGTDPNDPNRGQWFYALLDVGQSTTMRARITNPATEPQTVRVYLRDMVFNSEGTPILNDEGPQTEVGLWGSFDRDTVDLAPESSVEVSFRVTVPPNAEPGDHLGALVVESGEPSADGGLLQIVTRVATRLYVTVPGEATRSFAIESTKHNLNSWLFPSKLSVEAVLRNTGRMRLHPSGKFGGIAAKGPDLILSASVEPYRADVPVPWWGGPRRVPIEFTTEEGLTREAIVSLFVIPWGLLLSLAALGALGFLARTLWARRNRKVRRMQEDIRRLEELVAAKNTATTISDLPATPASEHQRHAALKRARRTGDKAPQPRSPTKPPTPQAGEKSAEQKTKTERARRRAKP